MLDHAKIRKALRGPLLLDPDAGPALPSGRAWENEEFTPPEPDPTDPDATSWLRETLLPGEEVRTAVGVIEGNGIYQVDVFYPKGAGTERPDAIQKQLADLYDPRSTPTVTFDDPESDTVEPVNVVIVRTVRLAARYERDVWYVLPVQVTWRCHHVNDEA